MVGIMFIGRLLSLPYDARQAKLMWSLSIPSHTLDPRLARYDAFSGFLARMSSPAMPQIRCAATHSCVHQILVFTWIGDEAPCATAMSVHQPSISLSPLLNNRISAESDQATTHPLPACQHNVPSARDILISWKTTLFFRYLTSLDSRS